MNQEENCPDTLVGEIDPEWVNHWEEDNEKKGHSTKQVTF
jgi:hypothetical protein